MILPMGMLEHVFLELGIMSCLWLAGDYVVFMVFMVLEHNKKEVSKLRARDGVEVYLGGLKKKVAREMEVEGMTKRRKCKLNKKAMMHGWVEWM